MQWCAPPTSTSRRYPRWFACAPHHTRRHAHSLPFSLQTGTKTGTQTKTGTKSRESRSNNLCCCNHYVAAPVRLRAVCMLFVGLCTILLLSPVLHRRLQRASLPPTRRAPRHRRRERSHRVHQRLAPRRVLPPRLRRRRVPPSRRRKGRNCQFSAPANA